MEERQVSTAAHRANSPCPVVAVANQQVLAYIEATFNAILREISQPPGQGKPVITLNRIVSVEPYHDEDDFGRLKWRIESRQVNYHFPGKNKDEAWRFACVSRILGEIHGAIKQGVTVTKRDIFYHDHGLFKTQQTVDRYVDTIAHTCRVTRRGLNVVASPKGLVSGLSRSPVVQAICDTTSTTATAHLNWVLVVEKEATFNTLVEMEFYQNPSTGPGLLITAKGYPDITTKTFLRHVLDHAPVSIPVLGLFDWDPDGIRILKCYLYGSKNLAQEHGCNVPEIRWIGLKAEDLKACREDGVSTALSHRDRMAGILMLASPEWRDETGAVLSGLSEPHAELQRMLMLNRKAEIQNLDEIEGGLGHWLSAKLLAQLRV